MFVCQTGCDSAPAVVTEDDFTTQKEVVAFLQQFVPAVVPSDAANIQLELSEWLDYSFEASFELKSASFAQFVAELEKNGIRQGNEIRFTVPSPVNGVGTAKIDRRSGTIRLSCSG